MLAALGLVLRQWMFVALAGIAVGLRQRHPHKIRPAFSDNGTAALRKRTPAGSILPTSPVNTPENL